MTSFSQRKGLKPIRRVLQVDGMDDVERGLLLYIGKEEASSTKKSEESRWKGKAILEEYEQASAMTELT